MVDRMKRGGRVFYIGAGTSGRLGVVDASEIPPTYGAPFDLFIGLIAGGDSAIRKAVEGAEDEKDGAWRDLAPYHPEEKDTLIGIAASGSTPYVVGGIEMAREHGLLTGFCRGCRSPDSHRSGGGTGVRDGKHQNEGRNSPEADLEYDFDGYYDPTWPRSRKQDDRYAVV